MTGFSSSVDRVIFFSFLGPSYNLQKNIHQGTLAFVSQIDIKYYYFTSEEKLCFIQGCAMDGQAVQATPLCQTGPRFVCLCHAQWFLCFNKE
jgi:hypothetical protein